MQGYGQPSANAEPGFRSISERLSQVLIRVDNGNDGLQKILGKLRGVNPSPIGNAKDAPQPAPNIELIITRLENALCDTEGHVSEIDRLV